MESHQAAGPSALFADHLSVVTAHSARALSASRYDGLLLFSGTRRLVYRDDIHYPFRANAPFKAFLPLTDTPESFVYFAPGTKPLLIFHRDDDYWHKPASLPEQEWIASFEVRIVSSRAAARAALPRDLSRCAFVGEAFPELTDFGVGAVNPEHLLVRLEFPRAIKTPYELAAMRTANLLGVTWPLPKLLRPADPSSISHWRSCAAPDCANRNYRTTQSSP
jgi:Xaa-Pro dipeptidase